MKKYWKKAIGASLLALMTLAGCGATTNTADQLNQIQEKKKIILATSPDYAPFEFKQMIDGKDQVVGADISMAQDIADQLGVELDIQEVSFDNVLLSVSEGKADMGIAGISVTEERKAAFDFSEPYYTISNAVLIRKSDANKWKSLEDLEGAKIDVQSGSTQESFAKENLAKSQITSVGDTGQEVSELQAGKIDAALLDKSVAESYAANNQDLMVASFEVGGETSFAIALPKGSTALKEKIDEIIKKMKQSGTYDTYLSEAKKLLEEK